MDGFTDSIDMSLSKLWALVMDGEAQSAAVHRVAKSRTLLSDGTELIPFRGFPGSSVVKESTCNTGDPGSIPGSGKSPGDETG